MISLMFDPDSDLFLVVSVIFYFGTQNFFYLSFTIRLLNTKKKKNNK